MWELREVVFKYQLIQKKILVQVWLPYLSRKTQKISCNEPDCRQQVHE